jgi:chromosome partitioning protein
MIVIAVASTKGGVGKTTLAASLAVCAATDDKAARVALVDLDPQESLRWWWGARGSPTNPQVMAGESSALDAIDKLQQVSSADWVILDGPPGFLASVDEMVQVADLVIVPTKTGMIDIIGSEGAVATANKHGKPYLVVLNDVHKGDGTDTSALEFLKANHLPVAKTIVSHRVAHVRAMSAGQTAIEVDGGRHKEAIKDLRSLWSEVRAAATKAAKARVAA